MQSIEGDALLVNMLAVMLIEIQIPLCLRLCNPSCYGGCTQKVFFSFSSLLSFLPVSRGKKIEISVIFTHFCVHLCTLCSTAMACPSLTTRVVGVNRGIQAWKTQTLCDSPACRLLLKCPRPGCPWSAAAICTVLCPASPPTSSPRSGVCRCVGSIHRTPWWNQQRAGVFPTSVPMQGRCAKPLPMTASSL